VLLHKILRYFCIFQTSLVSSSLAFFSFTKAVFLSKKKGAVKMYRPHIQTYIAENPIFF